MLGQQGLVRRDDVFAAFQQLQHDRPIRLQPAHHLDHGDDFLIGQHLSQVVGQHAGGHRDIPRSGEVGVDDLHQFDPLSGALGDAVAAFQQQPRHARTDGSESDNGNFARFHNHTWARETGQEPSQRRQS